MDKALSISYRGSRKESMDYAFLRKKGIEFTQKISGDIWTDFNDHDPGITILEALCFAITDLGYRTNFPIEDILFSRNAQNDKPSNNAFYSLFDILPCNPLTVNDYRKLLIDQMPKLANVWVEPVADNMQGIKGLFKVYLQLLENDDESHPEIINEVGDILKNYRNLCEDFESIEILQTESISISAKIEIHPDSIGEYVLAQILFELDSYFDSSVRFHSLEELLEAGYPINHIFDGPPPVHGFIKTEDLKPLSKVVFISNIREIILNIPGVYSIKDIIVRKDSMRIYEDLIVLSENHHLILDKDMVQDIGQVYPIKLYKDRLEYEFNLNEVFRLLDSLSGKDNKGLRLTIKLREEGISSTKKVKELERYISFQRFFPAVYGIGPFGLPLHASLDRKGQAKQLKAYLLLFEQFLANHLVQLANIRQLFSIEERVQNTYFTQAPFDIPDIYPLLKAKDREDFEKSLNELNRNFDPYKNRRNRFLDHLLGRFGEDFDSDLLVKLNAENLEGEDIDSYIIKLIENKAFLLRNYVEISRDRGKGKSYKEAHGLESISSFERRICLYLDIDITSDKSLCGTFEDIMKNFYSAEEEEVEEKKETLYTGEQDEPITIEHFGMAESEETESLDMEDQFVFSSDSEELIAEILYCGIQEHRYEIFPNPADDGNTYLITFTPENKEKSIKIFQGKTYKTCEYAIEQLVTYLKQVNKNSEGFYLVEHIALRPVKESLHGFKLIDENGEVLLNTFQMNDLKTQRFISDDILILGSRPQNYFIQEEDGKFFGLLNDDEGTTIMKTAEHFNNKREASEKILKIIEYIQSIKKGQSSLINSRIEFYSDHKEGDDFGGDFYSLQVSVVAPNWPARFQNDKFRRFFEETIVTNLPAHLAVNFFWIDYNAMENFETLYQEWISEKNKIPPDKSMLDDRSIKLAQLLSSL